MFKWMDLRKHIRREIDVREKMLEVIRKKKEAADAALRKMNQWNSSNERRFRSIPIEFERRRA